MVVREVNESTTRELLGVEVETSSDPSGIPPGFALISDTQPTSFMPGTWDGTWDPTTGKINALSPMVGEGEALPVVGGQDYNFYVQWANGITGEQPVRFVGTYRFT